MRWFMREVVPRFPGMLAAGKFTTSVNCNFRSHRFLTEVLVLNYTWAHSGVWNIAK